MKKLILTLFLGVFNVLVAQKIDLKVIKDNIKNEKSEFYYERLLTRFRGVPALMSDEEIRHLYYGQIFVQSASTDTDFENFENIFLKRGKLKEEEKAKGLEYGEKVLEKNPVKLEVLMIKSLYEKKSIYETRFQKLMSVIASSGDGSTIDTPYCVASVSDGYFIGNVQGKKLREYKRKTHWTKDGAIDEFMKGKEKLYIKVFYDRY